ncbi:MAG: hypothetical protein H6739_38010 [Alphaproteobacteria bacterium]|nr:hypothetical protein [Alphaproteobacteria bacterium]
MPTWTELKAGWTQGWQALEAQARQAYDAAIRATPSAFQDRVAAFVAVLHSARGDLDLSRALVAKLPPGPEQAGEVQRLQRLEERYHTLAAGLYSDATVAHQPAMGVAPVLVVGGLAIGVAGTAWAVAAYEYAANLREQTALATEELSARVEASREGRPLQPSTLPAPPPPTPGGGWAPYALGGAALLGAVLVLPHFLRS